MLFCFFFNDILVSKLTVHCASNQGYITHFEILLKLWSFPNSYLLQQIFFKMTKWGQLFKQVSLFGIHTHILFKNCAWSYKTKYSGRTGP